MQLHLRGLHPIFFCQTLETHFAVGVGVEQAIFNVVFGEIYWCVCVCEHFWCVVKCLIVW